jgi:hypothetical protein
MRSAQLLDNLNNTVRENPVAAGLIGLGLAWMVFGQSRTMVRDTRGAVRVAKNTMSTAADAASGIIEPTVRGVADQVRTTTSQMSEAVSDGISAAGAMMRDAADNLSPTVDGGEDVNGGRWASARGREMVEFLERQPLALAVVGVAVGAAIASSFPRTDAEDRFMGTAGETLRETAADAVSTVGDRVVAAVDAATDEAVAQNLTPGAAREAMRTGVGKVKNVAKAGLEGAGGR